jgi:hypothetical protein
MSKVLPDAVLGSFIGFAVGVLAHTGLALCGLEPPGYMALVLGVAGTLVGGTVGVCLSSPSGRLRSIARWCVGTAGVVGGVAFLAGFVGPILLRPDSPQGPLLGIFITGPLGTVAGAVVGALLGALAYRPPRPARSSVAAASRRSDRRPAEACSAAGPSGQTA